MATLNLLPPILNFVFAPKPQGGVIPNADFC